MLLGFTVIHTAGMTPTIVQTKSQTAGFEPIGSSTAACS